MRVEPHVELPQSVYRSVPLRRQFPGTSAVHLGQDPNEIVSYTNEDDLDGYLAEVLQKI